MKRVRHYALWLGLLAVPAFAQIADQAAQTAEPSPDGFRFVPRLNEALSRRAFAPRVNALLRQLLKRLALDRERGRAS